jgi:hypothetical protein
LIVSHAPVTLKLPNRKKPTMNAPSLFDGHDDDEGADKDGRLTRQLDRVYYTMLSRSWLTLSEVSVIADAPEASVQARMRDLRKPWFGEHTVEKHHQGNGLYLYRLIPSECGLLDGKRTSNPKAEARERITAFLDARMRSGNLDPELITAFNGKPLYTADLREMLR